MSTESRIRNYCMMIEHLNDNTVASVHQIKLKDEKEWHDSIPTYFIYSFFTFNSIYSIDWEKTKDNNKFTYSCYGEKLSISRLLYFCFQNANSQDKYYLVYNVRSVLQESFVSQSLEYIKPDESSIGNVVTKEKDSKGRTHYPIIEFKNAVSKFMKGDTPNMNDCDAIAQFIYKIRCNLFHGLKLVCQLEKPNDDLAHELDKLKVYTVFLNSLNSFCIRQVKRELHVR